MENTAEGRAKGRLVNDSSFKRSSSPHKGNASQLSHLLKMLALMTVAVEIISDMNLGPYANFMSFSWGLSLCLVDVS